MKNIQLQTVKISTFSFINKAGGTGMSNWAYNENFEGACEVEVISSFGSRKIGKRFIGISSDKKLNEYLEKNANKDDKRIFFGEFDITK